MIILQSYKKNKKKKSITTLTTLPLNILVWGFVVLSHLDHKTKNTFMPVESSLVVSSILFSYWFTDALHWRNTKRGNKLLSCFWLWDAVMILYWHMIFLLINIGTSVRESPVSCSVRIAWALHLSCRMCLRTALPSSHSSERQSAIPPSSSGDWLFAPEGPLISQDAGGGPALLSFR